MGQRGVDQYGENQPEQKIANVVLGRKPAECLAKYRVHLDPSEWRIGKAATLASPGIHHQRL
jgi:hypothetical protein